MSVYDPTRVRGFLALLKEQDKGGRPPKEPGVRRMIVSYSISEVLVGWVKFRAKEANTSYSAVIESALETYKALMESAG